MKRFAFVISFICFLAFSSSTFSQFAFAQDKKVIKKKIRKKVSIEKTDGKITIKKKINIKKTVKNRKGEDKGSRGIPKKIRKLNAKVNALQQQVDTIELTPGPPGTPGTDGEDGAPGPKGDTGEQGSKGDTGQQGIPGEKGETGNVGAKGETGEQGLKGEDGAPGVKGDTGEQGIQGEKGDTGEQGLKGDTGDTGAIGATGAKGDTGEAGPSGAEISGRLDPCGPNGGLGIIAHIPGRSFSVRLPFDGSFIFSHIPEGTHTIAFELNGNVIGMLPNVTAVEGQTTDVGVFVTPFCSGDIDDDGFTGSQGDCDNNNASVFPGATEVCDGVDNNCDSQIDEGGVCATGPVDCQVSSFGAFSSCSVTCGGGTATRTRTVLVQPSNGGAACPALTEAQACNTHPCAVDCQMSAWGEYSDCSHVCGGGTQIRNRSIIQGPQLGGAACGSTMEVRECNTQPCAVNCEMSVWSDYSACSQVCGGGTQTRTRSITQEPQNGGTACGSTMESQSCNTQSCCPSGETQCNGVCVDLNADFNNCGVCGNTCASDQGCLLGACFTPPTLPGGGGIGF